MLARQRMAWGCRAQWGRASTLAEKKSSVNEGWKERVWNNDGDITWKVMNITVVWAVWSTLKEVWSQPQIRSQRVPLLLPSLAVGAPTGACRSQKQSQRSIRAEINMDECEGRTRAQTPRVHRWREGQIEVSRFTTWALLSNEPSEVVTHAAHTRRQCWDKFGGN